MPVRSPYNKFTSYTVKLYYSKVLYTHKTKLKKPYIFGEQISSNEDLIKRKIFIGHLVKKG